jgi:hypothetical protein
MTRLPYFPYFGEDFNVLHDCMPKDSDTELDRLKRINRIKRIIGLQIPLPPRMEEIMDWLDITKHPPPPGAGWYAVSYCWDEREGIFPGAAWFNGAVWSKRLPLLFRSPQTFCTEQLALEWAREHDVEDLPYHDV